MDGTQGAKTRKPGSVGVRLPRSFLSPLPAEPTADSPKITNGERRIWEDPPQSSGRPGSIT